MFEYSIEWKNPEIPEQYYFILRHSFLVKYLTYVEKFSSYLFNKKERKKYFDWLVPHLLLSLSSPSSYQPSIIFFLSQKQANNSTINFSLFE